MDESRRFAPDAATVAEVRRFVRESLVGFGAEVIEDGALLVSEIAANVVEHAQSAYDVRVLVDGGWVRVEVCDGSSVIPAVRDLAVDADRGRGLLLLERIALAWGAEERDGGKCVWFELGSPNGP